MITEVMDYCNKHFICTLETPELTFSGNKITGTLNETYLVGQYVYILGTVLNDGAYQITVVGTNELTFAETFNSEVSDDAIIYGLAVPKTFTDLVTDITTWDTANSGSEGVASEKLDDHSITYVNNESGAGNTWEIAFASKLGRFKAIFNDIGSEANYGYR